MGVGNHKGEHSNPVLVKAQLSPSLSLKRQKKRAYRNTKGKTHIEQATLKQAVGFGQATGPGYSDPQVQRQGTQPWIHSFPPSSILLAPTGWAPTGNQKERGAHELAHRAQSPDAESKAERGKRI